MTININSTKSFKPHAMKELAECVLYCCQFKTTEKKITNSLYKMWTSSITVMR